MIILDANVLIGFLDSNDVHHARAVDLLDRHREYGLASSVLSVAEALVHPAHAGVSESALASLVAIGLQVLALDPEDAAELAKVRSGSRIRMPDAVALHAALKWNCELATFDDELLAAAARAGVGVAE